MESRDKGQRRASSNQAGGGEANVWALRRDVALAILAWTAIVALGLWLASHVIHTLIVVVIAALLAYALTPLVVALRRFLPQWLAIAIVYVSLLAILALVFSLVINSLIGQVTQLARQITALLSPSQPGGNAPLFEALLRLGLTSAQIADARDYATQQIAAAAGGLAPFVTGILSAAFDVLIVTVLSVYLLIDGRRVVRWLRLDLPLSQRGRGEFVASTLEQVAGGYIRGQILLSLIIGLLVWLGLTILGVPFAGLLGVLAFFLEFIPFFGPPIAAAFATLLAFPQGWITIGLLLGWFVLIHVIEGYYLQPRLVGAFVGLHPLVSLLAVLGAGELFGLWGALFAAPVVGIGQAILVAIWKDWRQRHPEQFPPQEGNEAGATPAPEEAPAAPKGASQRT